MNPLDFQRLEELEDRVDNLTPEEEREYARLVDAVYGCEETVSKLEKED